jgi:hypothetical protein
VTVSTEVNKNVYVGDGVTVSFAVSFPILDETHLAVEIKDVNGVITEKVIITDYTVNGTGNDTGRTNYSSGNVVFGTAPLSTDTVTIKRSIPILQETDYVENDTFPAESHEEALDKLTMIAQQQGEESDRTLKIDSSVTGFNTTIPTPEAGKVLRYNDAADGFENVVIQSSEGSFDLVDDPSPQLGGQLDVNGFAIGDGTRPLIDFVEDTSAVNHIEVENEASGSGPTIRAAGDDTNIDLNLEGKGTGAVDLNKLKVASGQEVDEISTDGTLAGNSDTVIPTEQAVKTYVDTTAGLLLQSFITSVSSVQSTTAVIPQDDTIPTSSEGTQVLSQAITPSATSSRVKVLVSGYVSNSAAGGDVILSLFRGTTCIGATIMTQLSGAEGADLTISALDSPSTTSSTTYSVRFGASSGTAYINADFNGVRNFGGAEEFSMIVEEIGAN